MRFDEPLHDVHRILAILNTSSIQQTNNPLYQAISRLIDEITDIQNSIKGSNTQVGSWTPVIGGDAGESGQSYSSQNGIFLKNGRKVDAAFDVTLSNKGTITGTVIIKPLPFTSDSRSNQGSFISYWLNLATSFVFINAHVRADKKEAALYGAIAATTGLTALTTTDISNTSRFLGTASYIAKE